MDRITDKMLDTLCDRLNKLTGSPTASYTRTEDGRMRANIGNFHVSRAYGGVCLHRMSNEGGGVYCPLSQGHGPKRELWSAMQAYIAGIETEREAARKG